MAAPSFVGAGAGVIIQTGGAAVTAAGSGVAVGDLVVLQVLQDGVTAFGVTYSAITGIENLAGTASSLTMLATDKPCGTLAKQHLRVGRATSTTCSVTATTTGDDLYCRIYVFRGVAAGTAGRSDLDYLGGSSGTYHEVGDTAARQQRAQQFTAPFTGTLDTVILRLFTPVGAPTDDLIVEIQTDSGGSPSGTAIGTPATLDVLSTSAYSDYPAVVNAPITSGSKYWIVARRTGAIDASNFYAWRSSATYPSHSNAAYNGTTWAITANTESFAFACGLADIAENSTGIYTNGSGATAAITDTAVVTLGADRLALNFVGVDDDNPLAAFAGATGGTWLEPVAEFASATGTDGAIQLQLGYLDSVAFWNTAGSMLPAAILGDGGTLERAAQSFPSGAGGTISAVVATLIKTGSPTDNIVLEIQADAAGIPSGTALATSAPVSAASLATTPGTVVAFQIAATLAAGTTYWLVWSRTAARDTANHADVAGPFTTGLYAGGRYSERASGVWSTGSGNDLNFVVHYGAAGTIDGGTQTMAAADNWGVIGFALKPVPSGPTTHYGATSSAYTLNRVTAAQRRTTSNLAMPVAFGAQVAGNVSVPAVTHYGALAAPFAFNAATAARRRTTSSTANPYTFAATTAGQRKTFGVTATPVTFSKAVAGSKKTFGQTAAPFTFGAVVAGIGSTGAVTHYGQLAAPFTFGEQTQATRKTYGATANPYAFAAVIQTRRRTTSSIAAPFVFSATTAAQRKAFGQIAAPFVFGETTQGRRRTTSSLVAPFTFTKDVRAQRRTTGQTATTITFGAVTASRKQYARLTAPFVFSAVIDSRKKTYGVVARPITFGAVTAGIGFTGAATYFGATSTTITFSKAVQGTKKTFGAVARPITWAAAVQGQRTTRTQIAAVYTWSSTTQAKRRTTGQIARPTTFGAVVQGISIVGIQTYYGVVARPTTLTITTVGQRRTRSTITMPITMSAFTKGMLMAAILNYADDVRWGSIQADRVMVGSVEVWTPGEDL